MSNDSNSLDALYARASEATRNGSRGVYFATRHLPMEMARAAQAIYWFCDYTRALPDRDLDHWESLVNDGLRGKLARHPVLDVFLDAVDQYAIPHQAPLDLIGGVRLDLYHGRYRTYAEFRGRCSKIGGVVAQMTAHVVGFRGPALDYMLDLGLAIEMTTLLRDTRGHLDQGRVYFASEEMERFGYSEDSLTTHTRNEAFANLMRFHAARIHELYVRAEPGFPLLDVRGRFGMKVAFDLYRKTLRQIEHAGFDIFRPGAGLPKTDRAWIAARSMAGPITRRLWRVVSA